MGILEALALRHSTRAYTDEAVSTQALEQIQHTIDECNAKSGLHIQMAYGRQDALAGYKTHYGRFQHVHNAIALIGKGARPTGDLKAKGAEPKEPEAEEIKLQTKVGYYGELLSVLMVQLGLQTSWLVLDNAGEGWWQLGQAERVVWMLVFGHEARTSAQHHSRPMGKLCEIPEGMGLDAGGVAPLGKADKSGEPGECGEANQGKGTGAKSDSAPVADATGGPSPAPGAAVSPSPASAPNESAHQTLAPTPRWFVNGMQAAMLAPTSLNQQPFLFKLHDDMTASARATEGLFAHVGLGCALYNFEVGASAGGRDSAALQRLRWRG